MKEKEKQEFKIVSGCIESGTPEQQMGYAQLFGEDDIQYKFDLYFHWYNLIHEVGHCIAHYKGVEMAAIDEELFVNDFAVSYYRYIGENDRLSELRNFLQNVIDGFPPVIPEGETFISYYKRIWNTRQISDVVVYGFFQLNSVLEAMKKNKSFEEAAADLGIHIEKKNELVHCTAEISSKNAEAFLLTALKNMKSLGMEIPDIELELVDNPMIQQAQMN